MGMHKMSQEEIQDLAFRARLDGGQGEDVVHRCDVSPNDHLHLVRVGEANARLRGRVGIRLHSGKDDGGIAVLFSAPEARQIAAELMNIADELDGVTPLVFHPPRFVEGDALDTPGADE